jgi:hypothetical protein
MTAQQRGWGRWLVAAGLALCAVARLSAHPPSGTLTTVALFDPALLETPESIVIDRDGTIFLSLALTGEVRKIAPDGTQSTLAFLPIGPPLTPCGSFFGILGALAPDDDGSLYASVAACDPANRGVWKISSSGATTLLGNLPATALPNGIALRGSRLYVADSNGLIWTLPKAGGTPTVWSADPLLQPAPGAAFPGPNGLQIFRGELYVSNSDQGTVLAFRLKPDGSAGRLRVHATLPDDLGCDDFAFDVLGNLYCTTDPFNRLLRIFPNGNFETLLTAADGLDGPTAAAFGFGRDRFHLYIANAAFPFFSTTHRPSLLRLRLAIPGVPRR